MIVYLLGGVRQHSARLVHVHACVLRSYFHVVTYFHEEGLIVSVKPLHANVGMLCLHAHPSPYAHSTLCLNIHGKEVGENEVVASRVSHPSSLPSDVERHKSKKTSSGDVNTVACHQETGVSQVTLAPICLKYQISFTA